MDTVYGSKLLFMWEEEREVMDRKDVTFCHVIRFCTIRDSALSSSSSESDKLSVTMAKLSSISCATCNLFLHHHITTLRCKTNITTSSFSSCNKCIRNRSKFLLTEQFFILIQQKSQLNKLKMMLLIIQKMY